ncbi:L-lactate permease [Teredinibacter haidensis]|uniref:L-lactate permease n=1 Tax=Teredinibacter haidensis TaxID=2731755 RepID=UPI000948A14D|nr:L-lactate permease [Teredinibacter haidensis]
MLQLASAYFPIVLLVYLMTKKNSMPSFRALPLSALALYVVMLVIFKRDPNLVHAAILDGLLVAWTPILIIAGAIFLFRTMEATGALAVIRTWLNSISDNPIAQLMIVGWAFQFLIEGASGFGTPAALAGPVLVGLGFPAVRVAIFCLILNSVPVSFGAVGTPTWFGLSAVTLSDMELAEVGIKSAWLNGIAATFIVIVALAFVVERKDIAKNIVFILLSVLVCVAPYIAIATMSYEFPSLLGGGIGLIATIVLAKMGIGLAHHESQSDEAVKTVTARELLKATFPLWGTVLLLIVTRVPQLGIKPLLLLKEPGFTLSLGSLGDLSVSAALVVSLTGIFNTAESWSHSFLYVPSLIPFGVIALLTLKLYTEGSVKDVLSETVDQMRKPVIALLGALVFVNLVMMGGEESAVALIGSNLANLTGSNWQFFSAFLGALGSFFSGSATISNLTFAGIQDSIAMELSLNRTTILALQSVGGSMGNMVCINNIVAVASVLALGDKEGYILKRTAIAMLVYGLVVGVAGVILFG